MLKARGRGYIKPGSNSACAHKSLFNTRFLDRLNPGFPARISFCLCKLQQQDHHCFADRLRSRYWFHRDIRAVIDAVMVVIYVEEIRFVIRSQCCHVDNCSSTFTDFKNGSFKSEKKNFDSFFSFSINKCSLNWYLYTSVIVTDFLLNRIC